MDYPTHILEIIEQHGSAFDEANDIFDPYEEKIKMSRHDFTILFRKLEIKGLISDENGHYVFSELGRSILVEQKDEQTKEEIKSHLSPFKKSEIDLFVTSTLLLCGSMQIR